MRIQQPWTTKMPKVCMICGAKYSGGPAALYCPTCRMERVKESNRKHRARKRAGKSIVLGETKGRCEVCGNEFVYSSAMQKYCTDCAEEAIRAKDREKGRGWLSRAVEKHGQRYRDELNEHARKPNTHCKNCGVELVEVSGKREYCDTCRELKKKYAQYKTDLKRGAGGTPLTYEEWLNRDKPDNLKRVREWRIDHPNGVGIECVRSLGVSINTVRRAWTALNEEEGENRPFRRIKVCPVCGSDFLGGNGKYCSARCAGIAKGYKHAQYMFRTGRQKSIPTWEEWVEQHKPRR
ncbi:hypothetical protein AAAV92_07365 [Selenomonas noxia]|uniref:hypothetical protein n=1 Tax=Selenomonas noxia TaxID=135083 RepID=UPI0032C0DEE3